MVGADQRAQEMRRDQADEADDPGDGDGRADRPGDDEHGEARDALHVDAQMKRFRVAERHGVEAAGKKRRGDEGRQHQRQHRRDLRPCGAAEAAHGPKGQFAQLLVVGNEDEHADEGAGERGQRDADEQHGGHRGAAVDRREPVQDDCRAEAAEEGGDRQEMPRDKLRQPAGGHFAEDDAGHGGECGT